MDRKALGAFVGLAGAQIAAFGLFALRGKPCAGLNRLVSPDADCLWGLTFAEYWMRYGLAMSVFAMVVGYFVAS